MITILSAHFSQDRRGSVLPLAALAFIPVMGLVGASVDYGRAGAAKAAIQAALDSATLMAAKEMAQQSSHNQDAVAYFSSNFVRPDVQGLQVTASTSQGNGGSSITMSARGEIATTVLGVMGFRSLAISATATAAVSIDDSGCVLALAESANGAITGQGSTAVDLKSCSLLDNSGSASALTVGGAARISAQSVGVVGGISGREQITTTQGIRTGILQVKDPYVDYSFPNFAGCDQRNFAAKDSVTLAPGVYCGGITVHSNVAVTLSPGVYYMDGGSFTVNGGASVTGSGVTIVFTSKNGGQWATAAINGNASINLTAPTVGPTAGIVVFGDRRMPVGTRFKFNGGATQYLGGAVYLPTAAIDYSGGMGANASCTQIIGDTIVFSGNSDVAINCSSYRTKPITATSIRLAS